MPLHTRQVKEPPEQIGLADLGRAVGRLKVGLQQGRKAMAKSIFIAQAMRLIIPSAVELVAVPGEREANACVGGIARAGVRWAVRPRCRGVAVRKRCPKHIASNSRNRLCAEKESPRPWLERKALKPRSNRPSSLLARFGCSVFSPPLPFPRGGFTFVRIGREPLLWCPRVCNVISLPSPTAGPPM